MTADSIYIIKLVKKMNWKESFCLNILDLVEQVEKFVVYVSLIVTVFLLFSTVNSIGQTSFTQRLNTQDNENYLENNFYIPPDVAKPLVWWHWMNGNITKTGITADLEAMKRVGIGGVQVFQVTNTIPKGPVVFMSSAWRELMLFAISEAARLGLSFTILDCAGWSNSGGPWVQPGQAMQMLAWTDQQVIYMRCRYVTS
jgi:hypothetical protein